MHVNICACFFTSGKPTNLYDTNNIDWAPTVNMGHSNIKNPVAAASAKMPTGEVKKPKQRKTTCTSTGPSVTHVESSTFESSDINAHLTDVQQISKFITTL